MHESTGGRQPKERASAYVRATQQKEKRKKKKNAASNFFYVSYRPLKWGLCRYDTRSAIRSTPSPAQEKNPPEKLAYLRKKQYLCTRKIRNTIV